MGKVNDKDVEFDHLQVSSISPACKKKVIDIFVHLLHKSLCPCSVSTGQDLYTSWFIGFVFVFVFYKIFFCFFFYRYFIKRIYCKDLLQKSCKYVTSRLISIKIKHGKKSKDAIKIEKKN
jgi:hypothetical protein